MDALLAQKTSAGKGYFVTDSLGSVYAVVDASGAVVSKFGYDVYGARTAVSEGMATSWGFTGRRHDSSTEMYYRARYLDGATGAFTAIDPLRSGEGIGLLSRYLRTEKRGMSLGGLAGFENPLAELDSADDVPPEPPAPRVPYNYASGAPSNRTDATGLVDCTFIPGWVRCQSSKTGEELLAAEARTGSGLCQNDRSPGCECKLREGPIPSGTYGMKPYETYWQKYRLIPGEKLKERILKRCPKRDPNSFLFVAGSADVISHGCIIIRAEALGAVQWQTFMSVTANESRNRMVVH